MENLNLNIGRCVDSETDIAEFHRQVDLLFSIEDEEESDTLKGDLASANEILEEDERLSVETNNVKDIQFLTNETDKSNVQKVRFSELSKFPTKSNADSTYTSNDTIRNKCTTENEIYDGGSKDIDDDFYLSTRSTETNTCHIRPEIVTEPDEGIVLKHVGHTKNLSTSIHSETAKTLKIANLIDSPDRCRVGNYTTEQDELSFTMTGPNVKFDETPKEQLSRETVFKPGHNIYKDLDIQTPTLYERANEDTHESTFNEKLSRDACRAFIAKAWKRLVENMNPWLLLDEFREIQFFHNIDQRDIEESTSTTAANRKILDRVRAKGFDGYLRFKECLASSNQTEVLHILNTIDDNIPTRVALQYKGNTCKKRVSIKLKDLRRDLIMFYMSEHSTLPLSPLLEENDAALVKFYSPPVMVNIEAGSIADDSCKKIDSYKELFFEDSDLCKNLYIISDAGYGKTSFAKRLVMAWCQAHEPKSEYAGFFEVNDLETVKMFDFVFFISLRGYSEVECKVESMIYDQIENCLPVTYTYQELQETLRNERCLVIMDGLDEWSHPVSGVCTNLSEIPHRKVRDKTTVLTTARSWKLSLAKLRTVDIDKQVEITGLGQSSSYNLIHTVIGHLNKRHNLDKSSEELVKIIKENNLEELATIPLIVMQLICLWYDGVSIGKSRCEIYSSITELLLKKGEMKTPLYIPDDNESSDTKFLFRNVLCKKYQKYLLALGELSFNTLFGDERYSVVFDRSIVDRYLSKQYLQFSFDTGLLRQWKIAGKLTRRCYSLCFLHKTYQEFFAALHIASQSYHGVKVCETIDNYCRNLKKILEMSKVFVFLSGINSGLSENIFRRLSQRLTIDGVVTRYRACLPYDGNENNLRKSLKAVANYQNLVLDCMGESAACQEKLLPLYLADILLVFSHDQMNDPLKHLRACHLSKAVNKNVENITSVSIMYISNTYKTTSEDEDSHSSSEYLNTLCTELLPSLQKIQLHGGRDPRNVFMPIEINTLIENASETIISLDLEACSYNYKIASIIQNMANLESLRISSVKMDHRERNELILSLNGNHLQKLKQLVLQNIKCYTNKSSKYGLKLNLSKYLHLHCISLRTLPISQLELPAEGPMTYLCLDQMPLKQLNLAPLKHLQHLSIANLRVYEVDVSQNVELKQVHISNLRITKLDLSMLTQLSEIDLGNLPLTEFGMTEKSHVTCLIFKQIPLSMMKMNIGECFSRPETRRLMLPDLVHLKYLDFSYLDLGDRELIVTQNLESLGHVCLKRVSMKINVLRRFVQSVEAFKSSVCVTLCDCDIFTSDEFRALKAQVRSREAFIVMKDTERPSDEFCFKNVLKKF
ncbi:uncharacterized protein LOC128548536 [Mercenaria mercenaria]|uniref:uncharacterized protein LOC128548536 n=1 Tax=Mercenaria mercenaria TaxID=6596 RepID=UPI00234F4B6E|nr:uncharacterized protein LOC128548536 [Mercenaria mercenaria]